MNKTANILIARELRKTYTMGATRLEVLKGVDLNVRCGEALAIVGASGAGKSTLLHLLGGLDSPSTGSVHFEETAVFDLSNTARARWRNEKVGFVFQSYQLLPELDALENVTLPAKLAGRDDNVHGTELLNAVGLGERLHHRPAELSGGEQQRVAVARALVNRPPLILADEPTGNLDSKTGGAILELLLRLRAEYEATLMIVTHDAAIAQCCGRTLHMTDGKMNGA